MLMAAPGLRAIAIFEEIIALQLEDCDWDSGHLRVRSKSGREQLLPMPADVGAAIAFGLADGDPPARPQ